MKGNRSSPGLLNRLVTALSSKTNELRNRVMIFFLLHRNQSLLIKGVHTVLGSPRPRIHCKNEGGDDYEDGVDGRRGGGGGGEGERESFIVYMNRESNTVTEPTPLGAVPHQVFAYTQERPEGDYRDLTHALFKESEEEMELTDNEYSFDDSCKDGSGSSPSMNEMLSILEDDDMRLNEEADSEDVDQAADLFIERFKRQMKLQKH